ncbi:hypothetical protein PIB30_065540 [Stylosanthes scabra]|uniref:Uncharacterized protein n=1 Tax=Stylosanthes scabra TaxID=79078 RepID=A0ABU6TML8_9FABA|nr:hypothetical protein [Stylosanthes scabra]
MSKNIIIQGLTTTLYVTPSRITWGLCPSLIFASSTPTYNAMHHVIRGATSSNPPQMTEAGRYMSQPHVRRGEDHGIHRKATEATPRRILPELILQADEHVFNPIRFQIHQRKWEKFTKPIQAVGHLMGAKWVRHRDGRPHYLRRSDLEPMPKGWYEFIYKFVYKTNISSTLPFPSIIAALCADAKIPAIPDDTLIPQEPPIVAEAMARTREPRAKNPRQTRQTTPPQQQPQVQHQQEFPIGFYTHFDTSISQIHRKLDQHQEENRRSFEAINTRMNQMDDQLSFLCYSNQIVDEQMLFPYRNTTRQFKEMEMQGIPVNMANLAIHRQREEEMNQERMRYERILQEAAAQQAREANKGKSREVVPDSEDEFVSSKSEEF